MSTAPVRRLYTGSQTPDEFPRRFTIFADTDHSDIEVMRSFRDTLRTFAANGGTHVVMEADPAYQEIFNSIRRGQNTLEQYSDVMHVSGYVPQAQEQEGRRIFQDIMRIALDNNMTFIAVDRRPEVMDRFPDIVTAIEELNAGRGPSYNERMQDQEFRSRFEEYRTDLMRQRRESDQQLVQTISGSVGPDDRAMIFYGANHAQPLAQGLGMQNTQTYFVINPMSDLGRRMDANLTQMPLYRAETPVASNFQTQALEKDQLNQDTQKKFDPAPA